MLPIELRVSRDKNPQATYYSITKVWPGLMNTEQVFVRFTTYSAVVGWAKARYPKVPILRNY